MEPDYQRRLTIVGATAAMITALVGIVAAITGFIPWSSKEEPAIYQRPFIHGR